jgi:phosphonate transport system permease protein
MSLEHNVGARLAEPWRLDPPYSARTVPIIALAAFVLWVTGSRVEIGRMLQLSGDAVLKVIGIREQSQVADGLAKIRKSLFPIVLAQRTPVARIENFDPQHLPWLSHVEREHTNEQRLNPNTLQMEAQDSTRDVLVEPLVQQHDNYET